MDTITNERRVLTTYKETDIYIDRFGYFSATPKGHRKERAARSLAELQDIIDEAMEKKTKRKDVNYQFRLWHNGRVENAVYVGVRKGTSSNGKLDTGHVLQHENDGEGRVGEKFNAPEFKKVGVILDSATDAQIADLEELHSTMKKAEANFLAQKEATTVDTKFGYFSRHNATASNMTDAQEATCETIRKARSGERQS